MPYAWPADTDFALWELDVLDRDCPVCGRRMYVWISKGDIHRDIERGHS